MARLDAADSKTLASEAAQALRLTSYGASRELGALHSIEDVFKAMASATPALAGLTLSRIGDLGVDLNNRELPTTAGHVVPPSLPIL